MEQPPGPEAPGRTPPPTGPSSPISAATWPLSHVGIVIGSPEVEIDGIAKDGTVTPITGGCTFMLDRRSGLRTVAMVGVMAATVNRRPRRDVVNLGRDLSMEDRP
jgi:hypothetical protein